MASSSAVHYDISVKDAHAHLWQVQLTIPKPAKNQCFSLPVWIPGSYLVREFAKHLQHLQARQGQQIVPLLQQDKCTWQARTSSSQPLVLHYEVYAYDPSVRTSYLSTNRAFFNPTSLCLMAHGLENRPHTLALSVGACTALRPVSSAAQASGGNKRKNARHVGHYVFDDYDALADTPFTLGEFWRARFRVRGIPHEIAVSGAPDSFDAQRLLRDIKKIVDCELRFWHGKDGAAPFDRYVFMLHAVDDGYGGLEHRHSTALICSRKDLPRLHTATQAEGYTTLLGLISHEYFHTWNVKRMKPAEFVRYDFKQENYTRLLWFFEGFTSYYDDLLLRRAELIDDTQYLRLLAKTINQVQQTPGRKVQSVAQASMDAWIKYYRQDENTPNATVSYYSKGALVALCFDLSLRQARQGSPSSSLDAVMRWLWDHCAAARSGGGAISEADFVAALRKLSARSWSAEMAQWVHGTQDLPLAPLLAAHGVQMSAEPQTIVPLAQRWGLRVSEGANGLLIKTVLRGGAAEQAGFAVGDEWLAADGWRIHKLEDITQLCQQTHPLQALIARDKKILQRSLPWPDPSTAAPSSFTLHCVNPSLLHAWLLG